MNSFTLSHGSKLPDSISIDGEKYPINPKFSVVLRCLRAFGDEELTEKDKIAIICKSFYRDKVPADPFKHFFEFVSMGEKGDGSPSGTKDFDYELDAKEVYSSFWNMYGIDLFETNLHWWKFQALLFGAFSCDTPISNKIRLRHADDSEGTKKASADRAKKSVKIKKAGTDAETNLENVIRERLLKGEPIGDLLK